MVKVEVEVPKGVYEALRLIGEAEEASVEELVSWGARSYAEAFLGGPFDLYLKSRIEKVGALLEA